MVLLPKVQTDLSVYNHDFGRIEINSPEQFVPLYVTHFVDLPGKTFGALNDDPVNNSDNNFLTEESFQRLPENVVVAAFDAISNNNKEAYTTVVKSYIKELLDLEFKYYTLPFCQNYGRARFPRNFYFLEDNTFNRLFAESVNGNYVTLGYFGIQNTNTHNYFRSKKYNFYNFQAPTLTTLMLIVVKAKHLKALRASFFLEMYNKVSIPYGDIQLLKTPHSITHTVCRTICKNLDEKVMPVKYISQEEMDSYVINRDKTVNTAASILAKIQSKPQLNLTETA